MLQLSALTTTCSQFQLILFPGVSHARAKSLPTTEFRVSRSSLGSLVLLGNHVMGACSGTQNFQKKLLEGLNLVVMLVGEDDAEQVQDPPTSDQITEHLVKHKHQSSCPKSYVSTTEISLECHQYGLIIMIY